MLETPLSPPTSAPSSWTFPSLHNPAPSTRYGVAVFLVLTAFSLRLSLYGTLDTRLPFGFFLPATMIAAWYGGLGPGLLAAFLGLLLGDFFFLPPHSAWGPLGDAERTTITVYAGTSLLAVILLDNLHTRILSLQCRVKRLDAAQSRTDGSC